MKRIGGLKDVFLSYENFDSAEQIVRKGKTSSRGVVNFDKKYPTMELREAALRALIDEVESMKFQSTPPVTFSRETSGGKTRNISVIPYFPDIVLQQAVLNVVKTRLKKHLTNDVYSFDQGVHLLCRRLQRTIHGWPEGDKLYALKLDVRKFYETIDPVILKSVISRLIKDRYVLYVIENIIDVHRGLTIGMFLAQLFSSIFLSVFDHEVKEQLGAKYYYRYADDMLVLSPSKRELHEQLYRMRNRLFYDYGLELKYWQVFDVETRPIDYVGYVFHRTHTRVRTRTKQNFARRRHNRKSVASYLGIMKWCNSRNLIYKILEENNNATKCTDK
jgi:RNA-directed DNA polymerase